MLENNMYQATLFGDFTDLEATSKVIVELMQMLERFSLLPNTMQEINPAISTTPIPRPAFNSSDNSLRVEIGSDKILVVKNIISNGESDLETLKGFTEDSVFIIDKIIHRFNKKGNRISLVTEGLFSEMTPDRLDEIHSKFSSPLDYYKENKPFEWSSRSVAREEFSLANRQELLNIITEVGRIQGRFVNTNNSKEFDRLNLKLDINTIIQSAEARLETDAIEQFFNIALEKRHELLSQVEEIIGD